MADKKTIKDNIMKYLFFTILAAVLSFLNASTFVTMLSPEGLSVRGIIKNLSNNDTVFWGLIMFAISFLLVILMKPNKSKPKLKGKDKMENQRFLNENELDSNFKHCMWSDLPNFSHMGLPFRAVRKGNNIKIHFTSECHIIIVGATGTGKTVSFIEPAIQILGHLKNKPSMFITDCKGELYSRHSKMLKDQGYNLMLLDLSEPYNSIRWNPLEEIYDHWQRQLHLEEEILRHTNDNVKNYNFIKVGEIDNAEWYEFDGKAFSTLKAALMEVELNKTIIKDKCYEDLLDIASTICTIDNQNDPSWEKGARDYFYAVLIAMLEDSENDSLGMTKERFNFYNAYKIAMNKDDDFEVVKQYFSGRSPISRTKQLSANITQTNAKTTRDGFMSTLNTKLAMFADSGICYLTSKNEVNFYNFDDQPTAFFIKIPDEMATRYTLASIIIANSYKKFVAKARDNGKYIKGNQVCLKRPLMYIMDEFANLPKVYELEKNITVSRSRHIFFNMVIQSYSQLEGVYGKENASTIKGNCKATVFLGTPDLETRKSFSDELGSYTIETSSINSPDKKGKDSSGPSTTTSFQTIPLIYPSDLDKLPLGENITKIFQSYPVRSTITPYFKCMDIYEIGAYQQPYIPGRKFNEQEVYYDIRRRNRIVLSYDDE